eukprot:CAMPEP_0114581764 /NCGR_PEP_ID=MMETSP0125-20121206/5835_1 /TAXON_ID=485358 ORGANISM="Aristerostoma sp., Strain ATCC 50986" /NCGR_SAMPLE_ID=MMETSP0125 /ASSEMBLY_ACC=CAM_ASM_000245 /LENGTH=140 /DNA_ID=CAMNT_0001774223 /DNA_START=1044 /DNA_END=1466 /DNA_ORIENTATION=-
MDIFTWSIPFVAEKVTEILYNLVKSGDDGSVTYEEDEFHEDMDENPNLAEKMYKANHYKKSIKERADVLRKKIKFISKMVKIKSTLREQSELITKLKGMCPDNKIPHGLILGGKNAIKDAVEAFEMAKKADRASERRPTK